ncbi:Serine/threonine-protein kinase [Ceratobasidium sp. AG-Ba]|nr:Serine/threonine-protein kinase [Ceratobasidium sp. AG-Ba]QRW08374.1 Serine/threonine-protein kinase [Ceratobasidium sp. AG-Ba]
MPSFYIELPAPLSRHNNNTSRSARPSLAETSIKSSSKPKNVADVQNIKPSPETNNNGIKRKRSTSDLAGSGALNVKKPRDSTRGKSGDKPAPRPSKSTQSGHAVTQPKWTPISTAVSYDEIMERMHLREFLARFQPLTKFAQAHLDTLSRLSVPAYRYLPRATLKAVLIVLLDLVGADGSSTLRRECQATIKYVRAAKGNLDIIWDALAELRHTSYPELPDPRSPPNDDYDSEPSNDEEEPTGRVTRQTSKQARLSQPSLPPNDDSLGFELVCGAQFLPILVFLVEIALQTPSVRSDIDVAMRTLAIAAHKAHVAKVAEEKERWAKQRLQFSSSLSGLEETKSQEKAAKGGKAPRGDPATLSKIKDLKSKKKIAESKHQRTLRALTVSFNMELRTYSSRSTFLGSDHLGRQFFILASPPRPSHIEARWDNWSTFVACWGKKETGLKPAWYGFDDPCELRNLATALGEAKCSGPMPTNKIDILVKSLLQFAEFLEDRSE